MMKNLRKIFGGDSRAAIGRSTDELQARRAELQQRIDAAAAVRREYAVAALAGDKAAATEIRRAEAVARSARDELANIDAALDVARTRQAELAAQEAAAERARKVAALRAELDARRAAVARVETAAKEMAAGLDEMERHVESIVSLTRELAHDEATSERGLSTAGVGRIFDPVRQSERLMRALFRAGVLHHFPRSPFDYLPLATTEGNAHKLPTLVDAEAEVHERHLAAAERRKPRRPGVPAVPGSGARLLGGDPAAPAEAAS